MLHDSTLRTPPAVRHHKRAFDTPTPTSSTTNASSSASWSCPTRVGNTRIIPIDDALYFTPARKTASSRQPPRVLRKLQDTQNTQRLRTGPVLPFLDEFTADDVRRSLAQFHIECSGARQTKKPKRKQSASF